MKYTRLAISTLNQWSLDFQGNKERIIESIIQSKVTHKAKIRIGPELEIPGYGCEDHFFESDTIHHSWEVLSELLLFISKAPYDDILCVFGMPVVYNNQIYNCGVCAYNGKIVMIKPKLILADDGNYRESRWFTPWRIENHVVDFPLPRLVAETTQQLTVPFGNIVLRSEDGVLIGSECCEELWTPMPSSAGLYIQGVHIIFNISGSHYQPGKQQKREDLIESITLKHGGAYMYSNYNGCDGTRLYFDAASMIAVNGVQIARTEQFVIKDVDVISACIDLMKIDSYRTPLDTPRLDHSPFYSHQYSVITVKDFYLRVKQAKLTVPPQPSVFCKEKELSFGPACWLWDYLRRSKARGLFLPLSGGADSASTLAFVGIMCELVIKSLSQDGYNKKVLENDLIRLINKIPSSAKELAHEIMHTAYLSTSNSSEETRARAWNIASQVGSKHYEVNMDKIVASYKNAYLSMAGGPEPRYSEQGGSWAEDIALQNIQARSRMVMSYMLGQLLLSSKGFLLVLASGNLEEGLTGYMTKYDCSSADINLIGGISKVDLKDFMIWGSQELGYTALKDIALAPPSAELKPLAEGKMQQTDEDDLGLTYKEMSTLGKLRRIEHLGPYFSFKKLIFQWKNINKADIATKVKRFYTLHGRNRHKMNVVTPSVHVEGYSADDNRFDMRPMIYNYSWTFQFDRIDDLLRISI